MIYLLYLPIEIPLPPLPEYGNTYNFIFKNINQLFKFIKQNPYLLIQIYNSLGNLVASSGEEIIKLKRGIYYYWIKLKEGEKRGKLIIQN